MSLRSKIINIWPAVFLFIFYHGRLRTLGYLRPILIFMEAAESKGGGCYFGAGYVYFIIGYYYFYFQPAFIRPPILVFLLLQPPFIFLYSFCPLIFIRCCLLIMGAAKNNHGRILFLLFPLFIFGRK